MPSDTKKPKKQKKPLPPHASDTAKNKRAWLMARGVPANQAREIFHEDERPQDNLKRLIAFLKEANDGN